MIVVDASVLVDALLTSGASSDRIGGEDLVAPHLIGAEVAHALRRMTHGGKLHERTAAQAIDDLIALPLMRFADPLLLHRAWYMRRNVTIYDGLYLALAEAFGINLVTRDVALAGVPGCRAIVEVLP